MKPVLIYGSPSASRVSAVRQCVTDDRVEITWSTNEAFLRTMKLDAVYLTVTMAERWGAIPQAGKAQVLTTSDQEQLSGLPRFIVAGGAFRAQAHPKVSQVPAVIKAVLEAVMNHDSQRSSEPIRRIGFWEPTLGAGSLTVDEICRVLNSIELA